MTTNDFPRTTIVAANALVNDVADGICMRSLFADWPKDRLSQVYFPVGAYHLPDEEFCHESRMVRPTGKVRRFSAEPGRIEGHSPRSAWSGTSTRLRSGLNRFLRRPRVFRWAKLAQETWYSSAWIRRVLERELRQLRPEIVFALSGNHCLTKITCQACARLGIPLFLLVTDDFVQSLYNDVPFRRLLQRASTRWTRRAVNYAAGRAGISPIMAEEYARRFDNDWSWFATLVDKDRYDARPRSTEGPTRLVFAGNLGLGRWSTLRQIALGLQTLQQSTGLQSRLEVYSSAEQLNVHRKALEIPSVVELRGWVPLQRLPEIFQEADLLVHVESFDPDMADYAKLSFSTKISQYMMAGRCILAAGPKRLGSIEMIRRTQSGRVITEDDLPSLPTALAPILDDARLRAHHGEQGRRWATEFVESKSGRDRFRSELIAAIQRHRQNRLVRAAG